MGVFFNALAGAGKRRLRNRMVKRSGSLKDALKKSGMAGGIATEA
jgi:hypothetical protein